MYYIPRYKKIWPSLLKELNIRLISLMLVNLLMNNLNKIYFGWLLY